jgi:ATPase family associated with various cellular activities (AAA)
MNVVVPLTAVQEPPGLLVLALRAISTRAPEVEGLPSALADAMLEAEVAAARVAPEPADAALVALADALGLDDAALLAVAVAAAVETDPNLCRTLAAVQAPIGGPRPLVGLLASAFASLEPAEFILRLTEGPAVHSGLLRLEGADLPLPERAVAAHLPTLAALSGRAGDFPGLRLLPENPPIPLPAEADLEARRWGAVLGTRPGSVLLLRTPDEQEAQAAAASFASCLGRGVAWLSGEAPAGLVPWLIAARAVPVFAARMKPGERVPVPRLPLYDGPVLLAPGLEGAVDAGPTSIGEWVLDMPAAPAREALWQTGGVEPEAATRAGATFRQGAGRIATLAARARLSADARGAAAPGWDDLRHAVAAQGAAGLDALAVREPPLDDVKLIVPAALAEALDDLLVRCRLREDLALGLGPAVTVRQTHGVRALFHGPSGTGKSLAAHWLAARLGMPLYRADLAALTSKWIGETEKNLAELLAAAEHSDVVLLFDEADSLFGARTDIGDAHDRFANAQTNYLLQRIETFAGIAVLTSNGRDRFDAAFTRRLDAILEFPLPDAPARRALWHERDRLARGDVRPRGRPHP